jgi:hypothetical protein
MLAFGSASSSASASPGSSQSTDAAASQALTSAVAPGLLGTASILSANGAEQQAGQLGPKVPLPSGGDFGTIVWSDATALGPISVNDVEGYLEYNAACQWWTRAFANGADATAAEVVRDIPQWPSFRLGDRHTGAVAAASGGDVLLNQALACDQSARRARSFIAERGYQ